MKELDWLRDGTVMFVPPDPRMDSTFERLGAAGVRKLEAAHDAFVSRGH